MDCEALIQQRRVRLAGIVAYTAASALLSLYVPARYVVLAWIGPAAVGAVLVALVRRR